MNSLHSDLSNFEKQWSSGSSETLLGLAIAQPLPDELHSWLKLKAAYD